MASNKKLKVTPLKEDQVKDVAPLFKFLKQSSLVNSIKNENKQEISNISKIKTFYENEDKLFEPTSDHYICYKHWIKD